MSSKSVLQSFLSSAKVTHTDSSVIEMQPPLGLLQYDVVYFMAREDVAAAEWGPILAEEDYEWLKLAKIWIIKNEGLLQNATKKRLAWSRIHLGLTRQREHPGRAHSNMNDNMKQAGSLVCTSTLPTNIRKREFCDVDYDEALSVEIEEEDLRKVREDLAAYSLRPPKKKSRSSSVNIGFEIDAHEQCYTQIRNEKGDYATDDLPGNIPFWASAAVRPPKQTRPLNLIPVTDDLMPSMLCVTGPEYSNYTRILCYNEYTDAFEFVVYTRGVDWSSQKSIDALLEWREELSRSDKEWMYLQKQHRHEEYSVFRDRDRDNQIQDDQLGIAMAHLRFRLQTRSYPVDESDRALWWRDAVDDDREAASNVWDSPLRYDKAAAANAILNAAIVPPVGYLGPLKDLKKSGKAEYLLTKAEHRQIKMSEDAQKMVAQEHDSAWDKQ